jgi:5-methyltetrahydropteroyltriglutamate--homocysteine methyltransferase
VLDSRTDYVEHPEVIAQRLVRYAELVGRERVLAGSDCGFATFATSPTVHPTITLRQAAGDGGGPAARLRAALVSCAGDEQVAVETEEVILP